MDNPKSVEVAERCIRSGKLNGVEVEMFPAITPNDGPLELLAMYGIPAKRFKEMYSRNLNCISAFLSHYSLWQRCAAGDEVFAIFEHDAFIVTPLPTQSFHTVMNIGKPSYGQWKTPQRIGVNYLTTKPYFPGAHAYMLTPAGAKELVNNAPKHAKPTDVYLDKELFPSLQEYYPFCAEARDTFTTIQNKNGCIAKHNWNDDYEIVDA